MRIWCMFLLLYTSLKLHLCWSFENNKVNDNKNLNDLSLFEYTNDGSLAQLLYGRLAIARTGAPMVAFFSEALNASVILRGVVSYSPLMLPEQREGTLIFADGGSSTPTTTTTTTPTPTPSQSSSYGQGKDNYGHVIFDEVENKIENEIESACTVSGEGFCVAITGYPPDVTATKSFVNRLVQQHKYTFGETPPMHLVASKLSTYLTAGMYFAASEEAFSRPLAVACLLCGRIDSTAGPGIGLELESEARLGLLLCEPTGSIHSVGHVSRGSLSRRSSSLVDKAFAAMKRRRHSNPYFDSNDKPNAEKGDKRTKTSISGNMMFNGSVKGAGTEAERVDTGEEGEEQQEVERASELASDLCSALMTSSNSHPFSPKGAHIKINNRNINDANDSGISANGEEEEEACAVPIGAVDVYVVQCKRANTGTTTDDSASLGVGVGASRMMVRHSRLGSPSSVRAFVSSSLRLSKK